MTMRNVSGAALVLFLLIAGIAQQGCASKQARNDTISATIVALDAARDGVAEWNATTQKEIALTATSREDGLTKLVRHYEKLEVIHAALVAAYTAVTFATNHDDDDSIKAMLDAALKLKDAITKAKGN